MKKPILKTCDRCISFRRVCGLLICTSILLLLHPHEGAAATDSLRESAAVRAVRKASPAVVNISTAYETRARANPFAGFG
ncbi:MAG TPA: hypothetical protein VLT56_07225, partial [Desulfobacterales bacterium]|nr:hypothetical protein [Desulfobacterales bacterium]